MARQVLNPIAMVQGHILDINLQLALPGSRIPPTHIEGLLAIYGAEQHLAGLADNPEYFTSGIADLCTERQRCALAITSGQ